MATWVFFCFDLRSENIYTGLSFHEKNVFFLSKKTHLSNFFFSKLNFKSKFSQAVLNTFHLAIPSIFKNEQHGSLIVWLNAVNEDRHVLETTLWPNCKHLLLFGLCTAVVSATGFLECVCVLKRRVRVPDQGKLCIEIALRAGLCFPAEMSLSAAAVGGCSPLGWMFDPLFMILAELCYSRTGKSFFTVQGKSRWASKNCPD